MLYVAKNAHGALRELHSPIRLSESYILLLQLLLVIPMAWIRHLEYFKVSNLIANGTVLVALAILLGYAVRGLSLHGPSEDLVSFGPSWLVFAGTSVFSFECINFVIPMYEAHEKKETFVPILSVTLVGVMLLFIVFGSVNYICYGERTRPVVTLNLPPASTLGKIIPFFFALASLLNVPLFLFPASITLESRLFDAAPRSTARKWKKNSLRLALVLFCTLLAWAGARQIEAMVAMIGSLCCVPLAFIYPSVCHAQLCKPGPIALLGDCLICMFGAILFVATTVAALQEF